MQIRAVSDAFINPINLSPLSIFYPNSNEPAKIFPKLIPKERNL